MKFDVNYAVDSLSGGWGDKPTVPFEHAILLHQLQTWIYFPDHSRMAEFAGILAASRYLAAYGRNLARKGLKRNSAAHLKDCLDDSTYAKTYDFELKPFGGWTCLMATLTLKDFDRAVEARRKQSDTVCTIIDYRFRYLAHGGEKKQEANISHGQFYAWKGDSIEAGKRSRGTLSGKTIRTRWGENKKSAEFVYVSEKHGLDFWPRAMAAPDFVERLQEQANDQKLIKTFLGNTACVIDRLRGSDPEASNIRIPTSVKRISPKTAPLSDAEMKRMSFYQTEYNRMRVS